MEKRYFEDETFEKINYRETPLSKGEYEACSFRNCDFSETDLSGVLFIDCDFTGCNLSLAKLIKTGFQGVKFKECKMLGLHFEQCSEFGLAFSFHHSMLNHSSFYGLKIKKTFFEHCQLHEIDLTDADLTESKFLACDLLNASFNNTNLEKADLSGATNFTIDPERNRIKKAIFHLYELGGLLVKYDLKIVQK
ncbi:pentapeptide repeat-containing protein [Pseudoflavitalea rhizosphaerae]|uniref:pentapeptide repeat-containing protein n=1 Tax=Pseudoflavitalea rhizosphaerae TaxID=1884793 RepID=UPI000F8E512F|nr:pentapeptide repeat-containing protein [Pseudoflavitalea rhizosphaerae]